MEALKVLRERYERGEVSKRQYDQAKLRIINQMTGTAGASSASRRPAASGRRTAHTSRREEPTVVRPAAGRGRGRDGGGGGAGLYHKVAPRTSNKASGWTGPQRGVGNLNPQRIHVIRDSSMPTVEHDPAFPFGRDKQLVGDAQDLMQYLEELEIHLQDVTTIHERHAAIQATLPAGVFLGKQPRTAKDETVAPEKVRPSVILEHAKANYVKGIEEALRMGVPVDWKDHDSGNTPLHVACTYGQRESIYYLVEQGANVNASNSYGSTPLHELIKNKRENLAVWLIKHGADIYKEDKRTFSPYDLALPWFQKDMKKVAADVDITGQFSVDEDVQASFSMRAEGSTVDGPTSRTVATAKPIRVYLQDGSFKSLFVGPDVDADGLVGMMAEKVGMTQYATYFQVIDHVKGVERRLRGTENILSVRNKWPLIMGSTGDSEVRCKFRFEPQSDAPATVRQAYEDYCSR